MASLASTCIPELLQVRFMEVAEAPSRSYYLLAIRHGSSSTWLPATTERCFFHGTRENHFNFTLHAGGSDSPVASPTMSTPPGKTTACSKGLCKVVWTIEADLTDSQYLYITGDPNVLGAWEPEMAVLMSPMKQCNLWTAETKVAYGTHFKYNYFIKENTWTSSDIVWRSGPEYSLLVPLLCKQDKKITIRDSWIRFESPRHQEPFWGSWIEETNHHVQPSILASHIGEDEISDNPRSISLITKHLFNRFSVKDVQCPSHDSVSPTHRVKDYDGAILDANHPDEEPWLLQPPYSSIAPQETISCNIMKSNDLVPDEVNSLQLQDQHSPDMEKLLPEEEDNQVSVNDPISIVILINSSICTMQRIAILEDEKLVELLLEPVKTNVQCNSVYLGVVTKLVPHMGGAFVNIGSSRLSLMDIKHYREPFIFPPFRRTPRKKGLESSVSGMHKGHPAQGNEDLSHKEVELADELAEVDFQDDAQIMDGTLEEQRHKNDFYLPAAVEENMNGGLVDYGGTDVDFEDCTNGAEENVEGNTVTSFNSVEEGLNSSKISKNPRNMSTEQKWAQVQKGTKIIVQVVKEGLGSKGPTLTAYPKLRSRFWILSTSCDRVGVSKKISGAERTRLRVIAKTLQPQGFGLTVRTVAAGHSLEELQNDLERLLLTWKNIMEHAKSAALAADEGVEGAIPVMLHRAMGQTLSVVQDYFNEKVTRMVVDSARTYHEVTSYLQEIAPNLCDQVELYNKGIPLFDEFKIEEEISNILNKRVPIANGGSLVIEQTEALVSIDVNGGHGMFGQGTSQEKAVLDVNLAAAKQIARELRLRDIGGIIVVDFIDMTDESNKRLVYEEVKKAVERDRSMVKASELSKHGLMEITRKRVRPSVTFMISEPCTCCHATGRVEALETSFSQIEREICRLLAVKDQKAEPGKPKSWPRVILRVDQFMCDYLTSGKKTRLANLSSSLKVWILLKVARGFNRGTFEVKAFTDDKVNSSQHQGPVSILSPVDAGTNNLTKKFTLFPVKKTKARAK